jgi:eukaryotic-like serine/threonine-protein kinase
MAGVDEDEVVVRAKARLGTLLRGKYRLDRVLGVGGMAAVYSATHRNGKQFAVKVLHADLSLRRDMRTRFLREGYLANKVNHPGAVNVLDDDVAEDGGAFLVMELVRGESVEALWERLNHQLPVALVAGIGLQLLDVLVAAHGHQLIHRDIKPANLMLTPDGSVKVLDFGIARLRDVAQVRATQTGTALGTPAFMAPEHAMAKGDEIDAQTDVWAVGATLFTLASGQLVHDAENAQQILILSATKPARSLASVLTDAPPAFVEVVDRALAFDKKERWSSATAMREALRNASTAVLGAVPTAATLSEMLDDLRADEATAERPMARIPRGITTSRVPSANAGTGLSAVARAPTSAGRGSAPGVGFITDEAVSTEPKIVVRLRRPGRLAAAGLAAGLVVLGAVVALIRPTGAGPDVTTVRSAAQPPPVQAPAPSAPEPTVVPVATEAMSPPTVRPSDLPTATPRTPPAVVTASTKPRPVTSVGVTGPVSTPPPAGSSRTGCNPPYEFDAKGDKRWKRECL